MNFTNIQNDTPPNCNCLENSIISEDKQFARHIYKPNVRPQDFYSKWEKWQNNDAFPLDFDYSNCQKVCGNKGVSIHAWENTSRETIINEYLNNFKITGKAQNSILVFKLRPNAGAVLYTPQSANAHHYDFYKADDFSLDLIHGLEIISLKNYLEEDEQNNR
jgi:hypothetical protein